MIASARMYEWAPSLVTAWRQLLQGVTARAGVALDFVDSRAASLDELWAREDLGCVFMCGYPYALRADRPALLAAPVPSPARFGGKAVYVTDFIVRADGPHQQLADTFGGTIAYSTAHSHSGYNAARYHLLRYRSAQRPALFTQVKGPYVRQRPVIQAVLDGEADVAAIDGYAHDLLRRHDPAVAERLRVVATTAPAPSPPLVAFPSLDWRARTTHHGADDGPRGPGARCRAVRPPAAAIRACGRGGFPALPRLAACGGGCGLPQAPVSQRHPLSGRVPQGMLAGTSWLRASGQLPAVAPKTPRQSLARCARADVVPRRPGSLQGVPLHSPPGGVV